MPLNRTYYKDMKVSPVTQLNRDEESLAMLLREKSLGVPGIEGLLLNASKNPTKVLYREGGIDQEIARRALIMESLRKRIQEESPKLPPIRTVQQEKESPVQGVLTFLSKLLLANNEEENKK